jgi:hypothetical protein
MAQKKDLSVSSEVKSRLEELFREDDGPTHDDIFEESENSDDVLRALKAVVLSIDWEINDETMSSLMDQISILKNVYQQDRILLLFLQLLGKLGVYIKAKKANAHPDSIKLLDSTIKSFEKAALDNKLSDSDRKQLLQTEVSRFMVLKEQVSMKKDTQAQAAKSLEKIYPKEIEVEKPDIPVELTIVIEEIKTMIKAEFNDMKAELRMLMKKRS